MSTTIRLLFPLVALMLFAVGLAVSIRAWRHGTYSGTSYPMNPFSLDAWIPSRIQVKFQSALDYRRYRMGGRLLAAGGMVMLIYWTVFKL